MFQTDYVFCDVILTFVEQTIYNYRVTNYDGRTPLFFYTYSGIDGNAIAYYVFLHNDKVERSKDQR